MCLSQLAPMLVEWKGWYKKIIWKSTNHSLSISQKLLLASIIHLQIVRAKC